MLSTLERLKGLLPEVPDDLLLLQAAAASISIEQYCKRSFRKQEYIERISGFRNSNYINLRNYPVHSITELNVTGYEILDDGRIYRSCGWPAGEHNLTAKYIGGYVLPGEETTESLRTLPEPIELACLLYTQMLLRTPGIKSERVGDISVTYGDDNANLPSSVIALISPYVGRWV